MPRGRKVTTLTPRQRGGGRDVVLGVNLGVEISRGAGRPTGGAVLSRKLLLHQLLLLLLLSCSTCLPLAGL